MRARGAIAVVWGFVWLSCQPAGAAPPNVMRLPVSFTVDNVNRSALSCATDDEEYVIRGEIVGPTGLLSDRSAVRNATLYLHEFSFGKWFWTFDDVPGYDYATAMARAGHVSIAIDRLGYDTSSHPDGTQTCFGAHADITRQIVTKLKSGNYDVGDKAEPIPIESVQLAGHSVGGGVAELAAHSFSDMDIAGLVLIAWADQGYSVRTIDQALRQGGDCRNDPQPAEPDSPGGYAFFGPTEDDFKQNVFSDTDPQVVAAATPRRNRDPCGDNASLARIGPVNAMGVAKITVPVLLLFGDEDANFEDGAAERQAKLFTGSSDVTVVRFPRAGHALALERQAPDVRAAVVKWLVAHNVAAEPSAPRQTSEAENPSSTERAGTPKPIVAPRATDRSSASPTLPLTGSTSGPTLGAALALLALLFQRLVSTPVSKGRLLGRRRSHRP